MLQKLYMYILKIYKQISQSHLFFYVFVLVGLAPAGLTGRKWKWMNEWSDSGVWCQERSVLVLLTRQSRSDPNCWRHWVVYCQPVFPLLSSRGSATQLLFVGLLEIAAFKSDWNSEREREKKSMRLYLNLLLTQLLVQCIWNMCEGKKRHQCLSV